MTARKQVAAPPSAVVLGPHSYTIDSSEETARLLRDEENNGDSRPDRLLVRLDTDRPPTKVAETLLHELMHCCWNESPLRVHDVKEWEELVVSGLTPWLLDLLRRNPDLVAYLTQ